MLAARRPDGDATRPGRGRQAARAAAPRRGRAPDRWPPQTRTAPAATPPAAAAAALPTPWSELRRPDALIQGSRRSIRISRREVQAEAGGGSAVEAPEALRKLRGHAFRCRPSLHLLTAGPRPCLLLRDLRRRRAPPASHLAAGGDRQPPGRTGTCSQSSSILQVATPEGLRRPGRGRSLCRLAVSCCCVGGQSLGCAACGVPSRRHLARLPGWRLPPRAARALTPCAARSPCVRRERGPWSRSRCKTAAGDPRSPRPCRATSP